MEGTQRSGPNGLRVRWWIDFAEFEARCKDLKPIGFDYSKVPATKAYTPCQSPAARIDTEVRSCHTTQLDEQCRSSKAKLLHIQDAKAFQHTHRDRVYMLRAADGSAQSRVGYSTDPNRRLRQHNRELAGGADDTQGVIWEIYAVYTGFNDESHTRS